MKNPEFKLIDDRLPIIPSPAWRAALLGERGADRTDGAQVEPRAKHCHGFCLRSPLSLKVLASSESGSDIKDGRGTF